MEASVIMYRLTEPHVKYGEVGRALTKGEYNDLYYADRPLFEPVNMDLTDYEKVMVNDQDHNVSLLYLM